MGGGARPVDGLGIVQPGSLQVLRRLQAVKFQPDILPGLGAVGAVGVHLPWAYQKPLVRLQVVILGGPASNAGAQQPPAGDDIVEQVVIAHKGTEGVERGALLPAVLVEPQVHKVLVGKKGEGIIIHIAASFCRRA